MPDVREVSEMVTKQRPPQPGALERQLQRQRRTARNRKLGAIGLVAALIVALGVAALIRLPGTNTPPVTGVSATMPIDTTPPMGVQLVSPDGTAVRQFVGSHAGDDSFQLSPDGSTLAYVSYGEVHTVHADGTNDRQLTIGNTNGGDATGHLAWSPDGSQLAYSHSRDIWVMKADGSDQHPITHATDRMGYYYPAWSVDGTIAMWGAPDAGPDGGPADSEIYTVAATGGPVTRLTRNDVSNIEPAWSADGTHLAYWNDGALWTMRADGSDKQLIVDAGGSWAPSWSPNGDSIAYLTFIGDVPDTGDCCYMQLRTVDLRTGTITKLPVHSVTDANGPQRVSNDEILINRYD